MTKMTKLNSSVFVMFAEGFHAQDFTGSVQVALMTFAADALTQALNEVVQGEAPVAKIGRALLTAIPEIGTESDEAEFAQLDAVFAAAWHYRELTPTINDFMRSAQEFLSLGYGGFSPVIMSNGLDRLKRGYIGADGLASVGEREFLHTEVMQVAWFNMLGAATLYR